MTPAVAVDTSGWSGEGAFTQRLLDQLKQLDGLTLVRVEDAPASRSEADYNFISNEIFVVFDTIATRQRFRRFGLFPAERSVRQLHLSLGRDDVRFLSGVHHQRFAAGLDKRAKHRRHGAFHRGRPGALAS